MNGYTVVNHVVYPWPDNTTEEGEKRKSNTKKGIQKICVQSL
ncbi:hypothetical protein P7H12_04045 [Paenibacillus larvae]|nr:hypothetical protein [Paenibacillus larvae]